MLQRQPQGPSTALINTIQLEQRRQWPPSPASIRTYGKVEIREAAVVLQCQPQGPSTALTDASALEQRRQCLPPATSISDVHEGRCL